MPLPEHLEYVPEADGMPGGTVRPKRDGNRCPECGTDLTDQDPKYHVRTHWPDRWDPNNPPSAEAVRRRRQLESMTTGAETEETY